METFMCSEWFLKRCRKCPKHSDPYKAPNDITCPTYDKLTIDKIDEIEYLESKKFYNLKSEDNLK